nr:hypothetical protein [uncultured Flavobacterium sp.]
MKKSHRQKLATVLGVATSLVSALVLIDFDTIDWSSVNDWLKILVAALPAIGGYVSEVKGKDEQGS